ncbi:MAG: DeoR/GlpR family DNA-binding transcription regulator [Treponema sp.]|jgi:DeoR/GlpR family transcriptional regulator of sugar metabolism|nr:DeoR/GlpR family DNA-binding transcription regulator [Treponema sp.]
MRKSTRQDQILDILKEKKFVRVTELASLFDTSSLTIRKDLNELGEKGKVYRTYGGAAQVHAVEAPLQERRKKNEHIKYTLSGKALDLISDRDSIFIDCGTTTEQLAGQLSRFSKLSVITTGLNIVSALQPYENITIYVPEGRIDHKACSIVGSQAETTLQKYSARISFFGIDGVTIEQGLLNDSYEATAISRIMLKNSQVRVLLADSSKFGKISPICLCDLGDIDILITDSGLPDQFRAAFEEAGVTVLVT